MALRKATEVTRIKRRQRDEAARSRILDAAEVEFGEAGFENARMHAIADRARLALGTMYGLFEGKHDLYEAIHARRLEELFSSVGAVVIEAERPIEAIELGVRSIVRFFAERPHYLAMHLRDGFAWSSAESMRTQVQRDSWGRGFEMMRAFFASAAADGSVRAGDAELDARLAIAMQQVFMARWLESSPRSSADELHQAIWTTLSRTFGINETGTEERR